MDDKEKEQLKKIRFMIDEGYGVPNEDIEFMYSLLKRMDKQIDNMSDRLTTDYHSQEWVKKFYIEQAENELETERRRNGGKENESND